MHKLKKMSIINLEKSLKRTLFYSDLWHSTSVQAKVISLLDAHLIRSATNTCQWHTATWWATKHTATWWAMRWTYGYVQVISYVKILRCQSNCVILSFAA